MSEPIDRFKALIQIEQVKMPWLEEQTGISKSRWSNVRDGKAKMLASEIQALASIWPEYALWLTTGNELPDAGQVSPMTKQAHALSKTVPAAG